MEAKAVNFETFENEVKSMPYLQKPQAYYNAVYVSKFRQAMNDGNSPYLPDQDGMIRPGGAYKLLENKFYNGATQLILRQQQAELGSPTGEFITTSQLKKAREDGVDVSIAEGEHPLYLEFKMELDPEPKRYGFVNVSQLTNPDAIRDYAKNQMTVSYATRKENYDKILPIDRKYSEPVNRADIDMGFDAGEVRKCNAKTAVEYFANILAASKTGITLKVTPEQVDLVRKDLDKVLSHDPETDRNNWRNFFKMGSEIHRKTAELVRKISLARSRENVPEMKKPPARKEPSFERGM